MTIAMLKLRDLPFRTGSLQLVLGGATKSFQVMLSGFTQFCGSMGANGLDRGVDPIWLTVAGMAQAVENIVAAKAATEGAEWLLMANMAVEQWCKLTPWEVAVEEGGERGGT